MFPHGATSYDRNKMVLTEFPYGVTTFFHQHFHMVLFILRNKLDFAFCVCEWNPIECHHSHEFSLFTYVLKKYCNIQMKFLTCYFLWCSVKFAGKILWCDYVSATSLAVLLHGAVLFILSKFQFFWLLSPWMKFGGVTIQEKPPQQFLNISCSLK